MTAIPRTAPPPGAFSHETYLYRGDEDFLDGVLGFVREGLERDEAVVVAEPAPKLALLRDALGGDARAVRLLDMAEIGANPGRIIAVWEDAVQGQAGRGLRGVGEPAYVGRRAAELVECRLHETLLDVAFGDGPAWRLLCPYDEAGLPLEVCAGALESHPLRLTPSGPVPSPDHHPDGHVAASVAPLPPPPPQALRRRLTERDVLSVRHTVARHAASAGLAAPRVEDLALAVWELSTNSIRHGGGSGTLSLWEEPGALVVDVTDHGRMADPLVGRRRPSLEQSGGRGVYLVHQLCDLVQVRSGPGGTTFRVLMWR